MRACVYRSRQHTHARTALVCRRFGEKGRGVQFSRAVCMPTVPAVTRTRPRNGKGGGHRLNVGARPVNPADLCAGEHAALLTSWLMAGRQLRAVEVALLLGTTRTGAVKLLDRLSGVLPLRNDGGLWYWMDDDRARRMFLTAVRRPSCLVR